MSIVAGLASLSLIILLPDIAHACLVGAVSWPIPAKGVPWLVVYVLASTYLFFIGISKRPFFLLQLGFLATMAVLFVVLPPGTDCLKVDGHRAIRLLHVGYALTCALGIGLLLLKARKTKKKPE